MAKITLQEQEEYPVLPADSIVLVKVEDAVVREVQGGRNGSWEKLDFKFKVLGIQVAGDGGPVERFDSVIASDIYGGVTFNLTDHPENKLRIWVEAILGMSLGLGFELDTEYLVGRQCRAVTMLYDKRATDANGNPYKGHKVNTLLAGGAPSMQQGWGQAPQQPQGWGAPAPQQQPMNQPVQQGWGGQGWGGAQQPAPQPTQQPAPQQDPWATGPAQGGNQNFQNPWAGQQIQQQPPQQQPVQQPVAQAAQQPVQTGWGNDGTEDPPF